MASLGAGGWGPRAGGLDEDSQSPASAPSPGLSLPAQSRHLLTAAETRDGGSGTRDFLTVHALNILFLEHTDVFQVSFLKVNEAICVSLPSAASGLPHPLVLWRLMA